MRPSNDPLLAARFRDEVLFHLEYRMHLPKAIVTAPQVSAAVLTIHAWNRQTAAVFFDNGKFLVAYKLKPKSWWKLSSVETWKGTEADPYDFESIDPGSNVVVKEPKFFVYVTKDGKQTEAGRKGEHQTTPENPETPAPNKPAKKPAKKPADGGDLPELLPKLKRKSWSKLMAGDPAKGKKLLKFLLDHPDVLARLSADGRAGMTDLWALYARAVKGPPLPSKGTLHELLPKMNRASWGTLLKGNAAKQKKLLKFLLDNPAVYRSLNETGRLGLADFLGGYARAS